MKIVSISKQQACNFSWDTQAFSMNQSIAGNLSLQGMYSHLAGVCVAG